MKDVKILCFYDVTRPERQKQAEGTLKEYLNQGYKVQGVGSAETKADETQVCTILVKE